MPQFETGATIRADLDAFSRGYVECALWLMTDEQGNDCDDFDGKLSEQAYERIRTDCARFQAENVEALDEARHDWHMTDEQLGHDFFLTRNGHGCGYWSRGMEALGERLSDATKSFGDISLFVGQDGDAWMD